MSKNSIKRSLVEQQLCKREFVVKLNLTPFILPLKKNILLTCSDLIHLDKTESLKESTTIEFQLEFSLTLAIVRTLYMHDTDGLYSLSFSNLV